MAKYAKRMGLSIEEARQEPNSDIEYALLIWKMDTQRDNLKSKEQN